MFYIFTTSFKYYIKRKCKIDDNVGIFSKWLCKIEKVDFKAKIDENF